MAASKLSHFRGLRPMLRISTFMAAAFTLVLVGIALPISQTDELYSDGLGPMVVGMSMMSPSFSIAWCGAAILVLVFHGSYHPGIDIGLDFIGWGLGWSWAILSILVTVYLDYAAYICDYKDSPYACNQARLLNGLEYASGTLMLLYGFAHLVLFVLACKDAHERRLMKKRVSFYEISDTADYKR